MTEDLQLEELRERTPASAFKPPGIQGAASDDPQCLQHQSGSGKITKSKEVVTDDPGYLTRAI